MQKITPKYLLWKIIICFLTQLMAAGLGVPFVMIAKINDLDGGIVALVLSAFVFAVYICLQYGVMKRSNLSAISKKDYLIGEVAAFSALALIGGVVLAILSGGLVPADFSYFTAVFFCTYACTYLTGNILLGIPLQILLFTLCLTLLYAIKKKKDPGLRGNKLPLPAIKEDPAEEEKAIGDGALMKEEQTTEDEQ